MKRVIYRLSLVCFALFGASICFTIRAEASELFSVQDEGSTGVVAPASNLFATNLLRVSNAGAIAELQNHSGTAYTGLKPPGMASLIWDPISSQNGQYVVGTANDTATMPYAWGAFLVHNGEAIALGHLPGATSNYPFSAAYSVNNSGIVVGAAGWTQSSGSLAYIYGPGGMSSLGTLGGNSSAAFDISNAGLIVGTAMVADGTYHAFLANSATMLDLNFLIAPSTGWTLISATGINDSGQVVAYGTDRSGNMHELLLTPHPGVTIPAPEPSSIILWTGLGLVGVLAGRRIRSSGRRQRSSRA